MLKFLVLLSTLLITSCATKVHGLRKTADFTYSNVQNGRLTIAGIVHTSENWDYKKQITTANQFRVELQEKRRDLVVDNAGPLIKKIGRGLYRELLREVEEDGILSENSLTILSQNVTNRRYIVFGRVESDIVENDRTETALTNSEGKETGDKSLTTTTKRSMDINFSVYDIRNKYLAWNGVIKKTDRNDLEYTIRKRNGVDQIIDLVEAFSSKNAESMNKKYPFPKAPVDRDILSYAFKGFAENLPQKD
ncbi:hypothetical protein ABMA70_07765 [Halobacteriovorax sp. XZX-3]|uniref:hypothetical protein n=1 Tax=unclassified Halobacteriovorax TaxID=2639665 RepID=UPI00371BA204